MTPAAQPKDPDILGGRRIGLATIAVTVLTVALVVLDVTNAAFSGWLAARPFTTATAAGILVLGITVLVVDQVMRTRELRDRSHATAAQAAIVLAQATRTIQAASAALNGSGERTTASDEVRTYMTMLLIAAPILIDAKPSRIFLERAQQLGGQLLNDLASQRTNSSVSSPSIDQLDQAHQQLVGAATPLLALLDLQLDIT